MTFLMRSFAERRGQLGEGERASAASALMNFSRRPRGRIDKLLAGFDLLRNRAQQAGQLAIGYEDSASFCCAPWACPTSG